MEIEISIGREITLCRRIIGQLKKAIHSRERQHGMTTESLLLVVEQDQPAERNPDFRKWREDYQALQSWQHRLSEYEQALQMLKGI